MMFSVVCKSFLLLLSFFLVVLHSCFVCLFVSVLHPSCLLLFFVHIYYAVAHVLCDSLHLKHTHTHTHTHTHIQMAKKAKWCKTAAKRSCPPSQ